MRDEIIIRKIRELFIDNPHILVMPNNIALANSLLKINYENYFFVIDLKDYLDLFKSIGEKEQSDWIKNHLLHYIWECIFNELNKILLIY